MFLAVRILWATENKTLKLKFVARFENVFDPVVGSEFGLGFIFED